MSSVELYSCGSCYIFSQQLTNIAYFDYFFRVKKGEMYRHFVLTTTQPRPQVFSVNCSVKVNER